MTLSTQNQDNPKVTKGTATVYKGQKEMPLPGVDFIKLPFESKRAGYYEADRAEFNSYDRNEFSEALTLEGSPMRQELTSELKKWYNRTIRDFTQPLEDKALQYMASAGQPVAKLTDQGYDEDTAHFLSSQPNRSQKLIEAGLSQKTIDQLSKDHQYIDASWLADFVARDDVKPKLDAMRSDTKRLGELGLTVDDLKADPHDLVKGDGTNLLYAITNWEDYSADNGKKVPGSLFDTLSKATYERHLDLAEKGLARLGSASTERNEKFLGFLKEAGLPKGELSEIDRVTDKYLRDLHKDNPKVFGKFAQLLASDLADKDLSAMSEARASVGGKSSQWWLRVLHQQKPEVYEKTVDALAEVSTDYDIVRAQSGEIPLRFNIHHQDNLSNSWVRRCSQTLREKYADELVAKTEHGERDETSFAHPSVRTVRKLAKLGVIDVDPKAVVETGHQVVGMSVDRHFLQSAEEQIRERLGNAGLMDLKLNPKDDPYGDPEEPSLKVFPKKERTALTKAGMPHEFYVELASKGIVDGKFNKKTYQAAVEDLMPKMVPLILSDDKAWETMNKAGISGGNQSGLYFDPEGKVQLDRSRTNFVLIASSKDHPSGYPHAAFHALSENGIVLASEEELAKVNYKPHSTVAENFCKKAGIDVPPAYNQSDVYVPVTEKAVYADPVPPELWAAAKAFSGAYGKVGYSESRTNRTVELLRSANRIQEYLPKDAKLGVFPQGEVPKDFKIDRESQAYELGYDAGRFEKFSAAGKVEEGTSRPGLPGHYSIDVHAGIIEGYNQAADEIKKSNTAGKSLMYQPMFRDRKVTEIEPNAKDDPKPIDDADLETPENYAIRAAKKPFKGRGETTPAATRAKTRSQQVAG